MHQKFVKAPKMVKSILLGLLFSDLFRKISKPRKKTIFAPRKIPKA